HQSSLPDILYPLSFVGPLPPPWISPRLFFSHPWILYTIGLIAVMIASACFPMFTFVIGRWMNGITDMSKSPQEREQVGTDAAIWMLGPLFAAFFGSFVWFLCYGKASEQLATAMRLEYVSSILSQDTAYFDTHGCGEITTRADKDINTINNGYGEQLGWTMHLVCFLITNLVVAFVSLPKLAVVLSPFFIWLLVLFTSVELVVKKQEVRAEDASGRANTFLEQCFSGIRVVHTFAMSKPLRQYWNNSLLGDIEALQTRSIFVRAIKIGWCHFALCTILGVGYYYGSSLMDNGAQVGSIFNTIICFTAMHFIINSRLTAISGFSSAVACVKVLRHHIERQPYIDIRDESGIKLAPFSAQCGYTPTVMFNNVTFAYPSRPDIKALDDVSFSAEAGQLTAIVGPSGAGKSSIAGLLVRQYDPSTANLPHPYDFMATGERKDFSNQLDNVQTINKTEKGLNKNTSTQLVTGTEPVQGGGTIILAGIDLREYNLRSLRSQISVVHQEPQLLSGSVFENIASGLAGTPLRHRKDLDSSDQEKVSFTRQLCIEALKKAEAWEFVQDLPQGMDTQITGGRTGILSGGQQQRLAIARALIGKPAVLILDEATSALSSDVELKIRNNLELEQQQRGLTVISIAHRLQFAQLAQKIVVMQQGRIVDTGTYSELLSA
ncbi:P-loop containing nucleoside triphosphate hydrolase protein, partial [Filobasidium floriforme]